MIPKNREVFFLRVLQRRRQRNTHTHPAGRPQNRQQYDTKSETIWKSVGTPYQSMKIHEDPCVKVFREL